MVGTVSGRSLSSRLAIFEATGVKDNSRLSEGVVTRSEKKVADTILEQRPGANEARKEGLQAGTEEVWSAWWQRRYLWAVFGARW